MIIRRAEVKDTDGIMKLLVQVNNVHSEGRPDLFIRDKTKYTVEELQDIIKNDNTPIFVAVDEENNVLGYSFGVFQSHVEDNNFPDIVTYYIDDLCVDEACRGQHIGKALYDYVIQFAKESGCYNVTLNVWEKNESAKRFYASCGLQTQKIGLEVIL
ncbi:MAG: GNAT family N-acetyltransferase [Lachnospiraceae bacterium]|nr:GNAT family N-acetyltransferase [Lachnospiraceae bacterium]